MDCNEALALLSGRLDGENTPEEEARLDAHLKTCPACRAAWEDYRSIGALTASLAVEPPEALARGVMEAVRHPRKKRRFLFGGGTLAAAAVIALLAAVYAPSRETVPAGRSAGPEEAVVEPAKQQARSAEARFEAADPIPELVIQDDPEAPAAETVPAFSGLTAVTVDGGPCYYVDAATARQLAAACAAYELTVPDGLAELPDGAQCLVRIVLPEDAG